MITDEEILTILEKKEKNKFLNQLQSKSEEEGHISPAPFLFLRKLGNILQYTGGILLGIFSGIFTLLLIYIMVVYLLHLQL